MKNANMSDAADSKNKYNINGGLIFSKTKDITKKVAYADRSSGHSSEAEDDCHFLPMKPTNPINASCDSNDHDRTTFRDQSTIDATDSATLKSLNFTKLLDQTNESVKESDLHQESKELINPEADQKTRLDEVARLQN